MIYLNAHFSGPQPLELTRTALDEQGRGQIYIGEWPNYIAVYMNPSELVEWSTMWLDMAAQVGQRLEDAALAGSSTVEPSVRMDLDMQP